MNSYFFKFPLILIFHFLLLHCRSSNNTESLPTGNSQAPIKKPELFEKILAEIQTSNASSTSVALDKILTEGNYVKKQSLIRTDAIFGRYTNLIKSAKREILLQTFAWEDDSYAHKILMAAFHDLCNTKGPEIKLRILVHDLVVSRTNVDRKIADELGSKCPVSSRLNFEVSSYVPVGLNFLHSKFIVIDGIAGIITGANTQKRMDPATAPWYDLGFQFHGPIARVMRWDFIDGWVHARENNYKPFHSENIKITLAKKHGFNWDLDVDFENSKPDALNDYEANISIIFAGQFGNPLPYAISDSVQDKAYIAAFAHAKESINIQTPNFNADPAWYGVLEAAKRGVTVSMILSKGFNFWTESLPGQKGNNYTNVRDLYKELGDYQHPHFRAYWWALEPGAPTAGTPGVAVFAHGPDKPHSSHAKYMSIDGVIAIIGSANMDTQTFFQSRETNLIIYSADLVKAWDRQIFQKNLINAVQICKSTDKNGCSYQVPPPEGPFW